MTLDFWQIIYEEEQRKHCYPFSNVYYNHTCTPYFENSVIERLIPTSNAYYIGVVSWRLRQKRGEGWTPIILKNEDLTEEKILNNDFDIAILCPVAASHDTMVMSENWHGKAWVDAVDELREFISIPDSITGNIIYGNHFIARREIYQHYVSECLGPAISFMEGKEVFRAASGYREKKVRGTDQQRAQTEKELERLLQPWGMSDYPISVFVLERLFRFWIEGKNFRIINL